MQWLLELDSMNTKINSGNYIRPFVWIALATGLALLIPFIAMQFTEEVNWDKADFVIMGSLLLGAGSLFVLISRRVSPRYRVILGALFAAVIVFIWAELAVGVFTKMGS